VIVGIHVYRVANLLQVAEASRLVGLSFRLGNHWKQDAGKNRDHRNNYQEFDKREATLSPRVLCLHMSDAK
jgi:hypothetical protein